MNADSQARRQVIQDILVHIDQDLSDARREAQALEARPPTQMPINSAFVVMWGDDPPVQMSIDQAVAYAQYEMPSEIAVKNHWEQYFRKRRSLLGRLPELKSFLERIASTDAQIEEAMSEALRLAQEQLAMGREGQQACHSNNVFLWNSLVQRMSVLMSARANMRARWEGIRAQQLEILGEIKTMLRHELNQLEFMVEARTTLQHEQGPQVDRERMISTAERLYREYELAFREPTCSEFVRDYIKRIGYLSPSASGLLDGQVTDQVRALSKDKTNWEQLVLTRDRGGLVAAFEKAQSNANQGKLVLVAWVNPCPSSNNTGHIAIVMPSDKLFRAGAETWLGNPGWDMLVPYVAQGGWRVGTMQLSIGFPPETREGIVIFVLKSPTLSQQSVKP